MPRWMFPINMFSVFFSKAKLPFLNHCAQVVLSDSDFFLTKNYDYYFKSKKKFPDSTDLKSRWLKPVLLYHSSNINFLHIYIQYIKVKMAVCESLTGMNFHGAQQLGQAEVWLTSIIWSFHMETNLFILSGTLPTACI